MWWRGRTCSNRSLEVYCHASSNDLACAVSENCGKKTPFYHVLALVTSGDKERLTGRFVVPDV